jgi:hypothetical protein
LSETCLRVAERIKLFLFPSYQNIGLISLPFSFLQKVSVDISCIWSEYWREHCTINVAVPFKLDADARCRYCGFNSIAPSHVRVKSTQDFMRSPTGFLSTQVTFIQLVTSWSNRILIYKAILKPIWTYLMQLWGTASTSITEILETFQSKALCKIVDAPWYVPNTVIRRDLQTPTVEEEIRRYSSQYRARLSSHPNGLVVDLMEQPDNRRLRRHMPNDLSTRFLVWLLYL